MILPRRVKSCSSYKTTFKELDHLLVKSQQETKEESFLTRAHAGVGGALVRNQVVINQGDVELVRSRGRAISAHRVGDHLKRAEGSVGTRQTLAWVVALAIKASRTHN